MKANKELNLTPTKAQLERDKKQLEQLRKDIADKNARDATKHKKTDSTNAESK